MHINLAAKILVFPLTPGSYPVPSAGTHHQPVHGAEEREHLGDAPPPFHPEHFLEFQGHLMKQEAIMPYLAGDCGVPVSLCLFQGVLEDTARS